MMVPLWPSTKYLSAARKHQMETRISKNMITFAYPFRLDELDEDLPAGGYTIETEDEEIDGASFTARRWIETVIVIRPAPGRRVPVRYVETTPESLERALEGDRAKIAAAQKLPSADEASVQAADNEGMSPA